MLNCTPSAQGSVQGTVQRLRLNASLVSLHTSSFTMEGPLNMILVDVDEPAERTINQSLVKELNSKFNVSLDQTS